MFKFTKRYGPLCGPTSSSCGGLRPSAEAFSSNIREGVKKTRIESVIMIIAIGVVRKSYSCASPCANGTGV